LDINLKNKEKKRKIKKIDEESFFSLYKFFVSSIRIELLAVFIFSLLISVGSFYFMNQTLEKSSKTAYVTYEKGINSIDSDSQILRNIIIRGDLSQDDLPDLESYYSDKISSSAKIKLINSDGKIIYSNEEDYLDSIDLYETFKKAFESNARERDPKIRFLPLELKDMSNIYLYYEDTPIPEVLYSVEVKSANKVVGILSALVIFFAVFLIITRNKIEYINEISESIKVIAKGNLHYKIKSRGHDEVSSIAENINLMSSALAKNEQEKLKAESLKNQLITNVSHDLRTPLTSIMGYLGLVRDGHYNNDMELEKYLGIAYQKSERLKSLIEDLFEYTKYSGDEVELNFIDINICDLVEQVVEEFVPVFKENQLDIEMICNREEKYILNVDPDKMVRVMDNLFMNVIKYSDKPSNVEIEVKRIENNVNFVITNVAMGMNSDNVEFLFDRFYKTDMSRSSENKGSGLGLAISKSIISLHSGEIYAKYNDGKLSIVIELPLNSNSVIGG
jgi:signal transduction histidine kinase